MSESPLLEINELSVTYYPTFSAPVHAVRSVSLSIASGETVVLVGETGSGKSSVALAVAGLLEGASVAGSILFEGARVAPRPGWLGMVFQDARSVLNPVLTVEEQMVETLRAHKRVGRTMARDTAGAVLGDVGISRREAKQRAFELSGGACQRVGVALALCNDPRLLIADEPTSASDPALQWEMIELLQSMKKGRGLGLLWVSHDLGLVARVADRAVVMCHGRVVEAGAASEVLCRPEHPCTVGLVRSQLGAGMRYGNREGDDMAGSSYPKEGVASCVHVTHCEHASSSCGTAVAI